MQVGYVQIADWLEADYAMTDQPKDNHLTKEQMYKERYNGNLRNANTKAICIKAVYGIVDGEKYFE